MCLNSSTAGLRDISPNYLSNEVFYGVDANGVTNDNPAERFTSQTKLAQISQANTLISIEGSPKRYAKGQKPREVSMNGILGELKQDTVIHPFKPLVDK